MSIIYILLSLQLIFTMGGYANEFEDHVVAFIFSAIFFLVQILLLYKLTPKKGVTIFISLLLLIDMMFLYSAVFDNGASIINNYPAELYHATWKWVIAMLATSFVFDFIKLAVLHSEHFKRI